MVDWFEPKEKYYCSDIKDCRNFPSKCNGCVRNIPPYNPDGKGRQY